MLLYFAKDGPREPIGVAITTADGSDLKPDECSRRVTLEFWVAEADSLADAGSLFSVWYSRFVGVGILTGD
jgi:hypothetical protein